MQHTWKHSIASGRQWMLNSRWIFFVYPSDSRSSAPILYPTFWILNSLPALRNKNRQTLSLWDRDGLACLTRLRVRDGLVVLSQSWETVMQWMGGMNLKWKYLFLLHLIPQRIWCSLKPMLTIVRLCVCERERGKEKDRDRLRERGGENPICSPWTVWIMS